jgi:hypothetical protein
VLEKIFLEGDGKIGALDRQMIIRELGVRSMESEPPNPHFASVSEEEWADIIDRLTLYAAARMSRLTWRGRRGDPAPAGMQPQDFVYAAISKCWAGDRPWILSKQPSLFSHLASVVQSDINHAAVGPENRLTQRIEGDDEGTSGSAKRPLNLVQLFEVQDAQRSPEGYVQDRQELDAFFQFVGPEPLLKAATEVLLYEGVANPKEFAERLRITVSQANNLKKRLWTKIRAYVAQQQDSKRTLP